MILIKKNCVNQKRASRPGRLGDRGGRRRLLLLLPGALAFVSTLVFRGAARLLGRVLAVCLLRQFLRGEDEMRGKIKIKKSEMGGDGSKPDHGSHARLGCGRGSHFGRRLILLDDDLLPLVQILLLQFHQLALDLLPLHFQRQLVVVIPEIRVCAGRGRGQTAGYSSASSRKLTCRSRGR